MKTRLTATSLLLILLVLLCPHAPASKLNDWLSKHVGPAWPWPARARKFPTGKPASVPDYIKAKPIPSATPQATPAASPAATPERSIPPMPEDWFKKTVQVSASFETSKQDPYLDVTPDFDGQGLTLGMFGWNIRQHSLQPLVQKAGRAVVIRTMQNYGVDFWRACTATNLDVGLGIVRAWQMNCGQPTARFKPEHQAAVTELQKFLGCDEMRQIQRSNVRSNASIAWQEAVDWARVDHPKYPTPTIREFSVYLDTRVQNGDFAGLGYSDTLRWYAHHSGYLPSTEACRYLSLVDKPEMQPESAKANAELWAGHFPAQYERLLLLCIMRAEESYGSKGLSKSVVLCRRGTILANRGVVNQKRWEFAELQEAKPKIGMWLPLAFDPLCVLCVPHSRPRETTGSVLTFCTNATNLSRVIR